jgi:hypothetical protein
MQPDSTGESPDARSMQEPVDGPEADREPDKAKSPEPAAQQQPDKAPETTQAPQALTEDEAETAEKNELKDMPVDFSTKLGLGFTGGTTSGIGFAFRKHFQNRFGMHIGAFFLAGKDDEEAATQDSWLWADVGGQLMYTLHRHQEQYFRLYVLAGGDVIVYGTTEPEESVEPTRTSSATAEEDWRYDNTYIVGAGLGFEFLFFKHVAFALELPLSVQISGGGFEMFPIPNGSLIYFF